MKTLVPPSDLWKKLQEEIGWRWNHYCRSGAGALTGLTPVLAQEATPKSKQHYDYKNTTPRELLQRRHLPNLQLIYAGWEGGSFL